MDISQKQNLTQSLRQEQVMTQKQIQALELLFLPVLELQAMIDTELEKNPILEIEDAGDDKVNDSLDDDQWLEQMLKLDEESRYIRTRNSTYTKDDEEKRRHYLESITEEMTLHDSLLEQMRFIELTDEMVSCCEVVISGLDDDGYLTSHPADLAMASGQSIENVNKAIGVIQKLEPPGVGAKDLKERLLLQLERKGEKESLSYELVKEYLEELAANHLPQIARKLKITIDELKEAISDIQSLNPRLSVESVSPHEYINEEVIIEKDGDDLTVKLKNDYLPNLFISQKYKELLNSATTTKETKDYIKEKIRSGVFLINSIIQRQTTIKKIVNEIVEIQENFFLRGREYLKPLTMLQVANKLDIHETTVSRAVAGKYLRCGQGLFPLKHFFTTGYETEDGTAVSKNVVKNAISDLIDGEDPFSPLSDSQITKELKKQGYNVARRTVAKYRESMNILPSNLRRQY